jgi:hypothetical protein
VQPVEESETSDKRKLNKIIYSYLDGGKVNPTKNYQYPFQGFDTGNNGTEVKCAAKTLVQSTFFFSKAD